MIVINLHEVVVRRSHSADPQARWLFGEVPSPIFSERRSGKIIGYEGLDAYGVHVKRTAKYQRDSTFEVKQLGQVEPPLYPIRQRLTFPDTKARQPRVVVAVYWTEKGWRYLTRIEGSQTENYEPEMRFGGDRWANESQMRQPSVVTLLD